MENPAAWVIPHQIVNRILSHAQRTAPNECVGILSGAGRTITGWHPLTNAEASPERFLADPSEQIRLFRKLREADQEMVAIYHSHPQGPAEPSPIDLEENHYARALHLIISLGTDGRLDMNGYLLVEGHAEMQELLVTP